jgi:hypothetical protein
VHHAGACDVARRGLRADVEYAEGEDASAFAQVLGGLIEANVAARPEKRRDFESLKARVGIVVTDIDEAVTLDFQGGRLLVRGGLEPGCDITIRADADTVMQLSNVPVGFAGIPNYLAPAGRDVVCRLLGRRLRIGGVLGNLTTLNQVTRLFSVAE